MLEARSADVDGPAQARDHALRRLGGSYRGLRRLLDVAGLGQRVHEWVERVNQGAVTGPRGRVL